MGSIAKEGQSYPTLPVNNYRAVCFDYWDIGLQKGEFQGKPTVTHKIIIAWEVDERIVSSGASNGQRYDITGWYTLSLGKKSNLRRDLTSWRGKEFTADELKGFDLDNLIGANCFVNVIHKEGKARVSSVTPLPKGMEKMLPERKRSVPEWVQKFLDKAITEQEAQQIEASSAEVEVEGDEAEVPF